MLSVNSFCHRNIVGVASGVDGTCGGPSIQQVLCAPLVLSAACLTQSLVLPKAEIDVTNDGQAGVCLA